MPADHPPRVSPHFPRVAKGCEGVANEFFSCFYEKGKQAPKTHDPEAGNKGLELCSKALEAYNACADAAAAKQPRKLTRVPEVYRVRPTSSK